MEELDILSYKTADGRIPYREWLQGLRDRVAAAAIRERIDRLARGLFGDRKPIAGGVCEIRVDVGQGYRVYYMRHGKGAVILLCAGDKKSQDKDIKTAMKYAEDYWRRT